LALVGREQSSIQWCLAAGRDGSLGDLDYATD